MIAICALICYNRHMEGICPTSNERRKKKQVMTNSKNTSRKSNPTIIWVASDSQTNEMVCFSSVGTAFQYIQDSHDDLNAEGTALMLETRNGNVPATTKLVKSGGLFMSFRAGSADNAASVGSIQSKLEGAISACRALGIDPNNVAKVGELKDELAMATEAAASNEDDSGVTFQLYATTLHKRGYKRSNS